MAKFRIEATLRQGVDARHIEPTKNPRLDTIAENAEVAPDPADLLTGPEEGERDHPGLGGRVICVSA